MGMKKIFLTLIVMVTFSSNLFSADAHAKRLQDMMSMYEGMGLIQEGFLLNCPSCLSEGIKKVQSGLKTLESVDAKQYLPKEQAYAYKFAQKTAKKIDSELDYMKHAIEQGNLQEAGESYTQIGMQCLYCHQRIRDWKPKTKK